MKKKILIFILGMIIALTSVSFAEGKEGTFQATMTDMMDKSAKEWFSSDIYRAEVAVLLTLDCTNLSADDNTKDLPVDFYSGKVYVGKNDTLIDVFVPFTGGTIVYVYQPISGTAQYVVYDKEYTNEQIEYIMQEWCADGYYKVSGEDIYTVLTALSGKN